MIDALEAVLRRPRTVLTLMLVMTIAGVLAYIAVPKEADPDIDIPVFYVSVTQQGISPEDAERLLARPMETALRGLTNARVQLCERALESLRQLANAAAWVPPPPSTPQLSLWCSNSLCTCFKI